MLRCVKPSRVLGIVLAGGEGKRLAPLTADRAKPAVPFGGIYRLVDFVLSNLVNGGYLKLCVLTQYKSHSLDRHITTTWRLSTLTDHYVTSVPAQQRLGPRWFSGSADAIFQSLNLIYDEGPDIVVVFGADHVYRMDPHQMVEQHIESGAGVTVAGIRVPRTEASAFGVISTAADGRLIKDFLEKPSDPPGLPDAPDQVFASMGNYVFDTGVLIDALKRDSKNDDSRHDMGGDIVPMLTEQKQAQVYDFRDNEVPGVSDREQGYWRDVGTLDSYYDAHQDLISVSPTFNLYNRDWPILTNPGISPPAKVVNGGSVPDSLLSQGVIVSGSQVRGSVLSPGVRVHDGAFVQDSVLAHGAVIGPGAIVRRAILDKNVVVGAGQRIGVDREEDLARGATISAGGVTVYGKGIAIG
jgi:glucose-1-phosphate adenylyltransferase